MATLKTQGFQVSALPRSPRVPPQIGMVDVKAIDEGVRRGLATFEAIRQAPRSMILADETADTEIAKAQAARQVLPAQTQAILSDTPNRSFILAGQRQLAERRMPLALSEIDAKEQAIAADLALQTKAQTEYPQFQAELNRIVGSPPSSGDIAKDMETQAVDVEAELLMLPTKFPWLAHPRYAKDRELVVGALKVRQASQAAQELQGIKNAAPIRTGLAGTLRGLLELGVEDDETIRGVINKQSAKTQADPTADRAIRQQNAQNAVTRSKMVYSKLENAAHNGVVEADVVADDMGALIDRSIEQVEPLSASFGSTLLSKVGGTEAVDLRRNIQTIYSQIGFQMLNQLRNLSVTGGALGNVSNADLQALQQSLGNLEADQSIDQLKQNLKMVKDKLIAAADRRRDAYARQFGGDAYQRLFGTPPPIATAPATTSTAPPPDQPAQVGEFKIVEIK